MRSIDWPSSGYLAITRRAGTPGNRPKRVIGAPSPETTALATRESCRALARMDRCGSPASDADRSAHGRRRRRLGAGPNDERADLGGRAALRRWRQYCGRSPPSTRREKGRRLTSPALNSSQSSKAEAALDDEEPKMSIWRQTSQTALPALAVVPAEEGHVPDGAWFGQKSTT